jgi:hypothetical protein
MAAMKVSDDLSSRADQALDVGILPRRLRCRENFPNA